MRAVQCKLGRADGVRPMFCETNRFGIDLVPILLWRDEGQVRLFKTHCEEKRLFFRGQARELFNGMARDGSVVISIVRHIFSFNDIPSIALEEEFICLKPALYALSIRFFA